VVRGDAARGDGHGDGGLLTGRGTVRTRDEWRSQASTRRPGAWQTVTSPGPRPTSAYHCTPCATCAYVQICLLCEEIG